MVRLFLAIAFLGIFQQIYAEKVSRIALKRGIPDGTLLTFFIKHTGSDSYPEPVTISFYDIPSIDGHTDSDIIAQVQIDRDWGTGKPVLTQSYLSGKWYDSLRLEQVLDEMPPSNGWWRVDLHKLNRYTFNVFFQGFYSGFRRFRMSLDDIQSTYIYSHSNSIDHDNVTMKMKLANDYIPKVNLTLFREVTEEAFDNPPPRVYAVLPNFPVGSHIELTTFLQSSGKTSELYPTLGLRRQGNGVGKSMALAVVQKWESGTEKIRLVRIDRDGKWADQVECSSEKPTGDLQHVYIERKAEQQIVMTVFYTPSGGIPGSKCTLDLSKTTDLDGPMKLVGLHGGMPLHMDHSIPRVIKNTTVTP